MEKEICIERQNEMKTCIRKEGQKERRKNGNMARKRKRCIERKKATMNYIRKEGQKEGRKEGNTE